MNRETILSPCRTYRYTLWREWDEGDGYALLLGLNPSTADEKKNDATIRREIAFAKAWGCSALAKWNLFAFRATKPTDMKIAPDPIGPCNDMYLLSLARDAKVIVAAWGALGGFRGRDQRVLHMLHNFEVNYLKLTKHGHPQHTLYLKADLRPQLWDWMNVL